MSLTDVIEGTRDAVDADPRNAAAPERYEELKRQVDEHCPVLDLFRNETPVKAALR